MISKLTKFKFKDFFELCNFKSNKLFYLLFQKKATN